MIDIQCYFEALKATWISRIQNSDPCNDCWAQIPHVYFTPFNIAQTMLKFNFDDLANLYKACLGTKNYLE